MLWCWRLVVPDPLGYEAETVGRLVEPRAVRWTRTHYAQDFLSFAQGAKAAGVGFPILPGMMVTSPARLRRTLELSGEALPSELAIQFEIRHLARDRANRTGATRDRHWLAIDVANRLIAGGAPGLHPSTSTRPCSPSSADSVVCQ
jgi:hypothetical protein